MPSSSSMLSFSADFDCTTSDSSGMGRCKSSFMDRFFLAIARAGACLPLDNLSFSTAYYSTTRLYRLTFLFKCLTYSWFLDFINFYSVSACSISSQVSGLCTPSLIYFTGTTCVYSWSSRAMNIMGRSPMDFVFQETASVVVTIYYFSICTCFILSGVVFGKNVCACAFNLSFFKWLWL